MRRRHLVVLISAVSLVAVAFIGVVGVGLGVGTSMGRDRIRDLIQLRVSGMVRGKLHIGRVTSIGPTGFTLDTFAIRGPDDSLLVSTGKLHVEYDPRDLLDSRLILKNVTVEHPSLRILQHKEGDWNFQRILRRGRAGPSVPGRSLGDYVILDAVTVNDGSLTMIRPWGGPPDSVQGAAREAYIRGALAKDTLREFRQSGEGLTQTWRWTRAYGFLPHVRLAHPDSNQFGQEIKFERGRLREKFPPFEFSNLVGTVRRLADSAWLELPHLDLPASTGSAVGKVVWGSDLPVRYDIRIRGDSIALNDVAWIYPTLPREGSGRSNIHIVNDPTNLRVMQYALTDLDARSNKSRLIGAMTFAVGNPVLHVTDVDLRGAPINFDLVRTLSGGPLPVDWQGDLVGMVRGPGGPVTHFVIDTSDVTFRDAHVPGAVTHGRGRGELDILIPRLTKFHAFEVSATRIDLRSVQYLFTEFPRLGGIASGRATLDSSWMDVRFSNADISHTNGPEEPSRVTGRGRVTYGERFMTLDLFLNAAPLSMPMISRAYDLGLKGMFTGPIRARGIAENMRVTFDLSGAGGRMTFDGTADAYGLDRGARGAGRVETIDLAQLIDTVQLPTAWVTGDYRVDAKYDTTDMATTKGSLWLALERSEFDGIRIFPSRFAARFDDRRIFLDTLRIESAAATVNASGIIGFGADRVADSIAYNATVDSIGGLRRYLGGQTTDSTSADSLSGSASIDGWLRGSLASLNVTGTVVGTNVVIRRDAGRGIDGSFAISDVFGAPTGTASLVSRTLEAGGIGLDSLVLGLRLNEGRTGAVTLSARSTNEVDFGAQAEFARTDAATLVSVKALSVVSDNSRWLLGGPADFTIQGKGVAIDSLVLNNNGGGRVTLAGVLPDSGRARILLRGDSIPLGDLSRIAQLKTALSGWASLVVGGGGTESAPVMTAEAHMSDVRWGGLNIERVTARGDYASRRAQVRMDLARGQDSVLQISGTLPIDLRYFGATLLEDSLVATIKTGTAGLDLIQPFVGGMRDAKGKLTADLAIGGTWKHPDITGGIQVENGEAILDSLGIRLRGIQVDVGLFGHLDSLAVRRVVAWSGTSSGDSVSLGGHVTYRQLSNPVLSLRLDARTFRAIDRRTLARLDVSTAFGGLQLSGPFSAATLSGGVILDRGQIFLPDPELSRKQLSDPRALFSDSTIENGDAGPSRRSKFFETLALDGVRVTLGDEIELRSTEVNIKIGGSLSVQRSATVVPSLNFAGEDTTYTPVLDGTLRAERGTYTLQLFPITRDFQVEGGTITFYPSRDLLPQLNITALHVVKRSNQPDLRIRVLLTGDPLNPIVTLQSGEGYAMSQSDMVSYLIFGMPSFQLGDRERGTAQLALQTLLPTGTAYVSSYSNRLLGPVGEYLQLRPGALNSDELANSSTATSALQSFLYTTRLETGLQLSDNVFVSLSTGLCQLDQRNTGSAGAQFGEFANAFGGKLEYRFSSSTALKASREPPASALNCGKSVSGRAFIETPSQWGLSLFKSWRF